METVGGIREKVIVKISETPSPPKFVEIINKD